ncbi:Phosphoenolpyruvate/pyruvate domain-containing protein, partial [Conidiobolus coronatus NRRL 28638]
MSFIADDINNFKNQVYQLEQKWRSDRFTHTRRPYNADIIVSKRGTFKLEHAGGPLSKKLWSVLNQIQAQGLGTVAFDTWNPSQVLTTSTQNLELSYISNQQVIIETQGDPSSPIPSPATPLSTLPRKVDQILRSQVWFDRRQVELRHRLRSEAGLDSELPLSVDFYRPIVVDADLVGSNVPSLMRLSRLLIERGAAGIQLDDAQQTYSSILNQANIKVLYPVGQHINRLVALRAQSDIMDTETVVFTKLSSLQAGYVASNLDTRDHPYILGATVPTRPLAEVLREAQASGASTPDQLNFIRNSWMNNANVLTYRDAIAQAIRLKGGLSPDQISKEVEVWLDNTRNTSLDHAKDLASQLGLEKVFWDWNLPRSQEGYYMYANTLEAAISRARHFAPYSDVVTLQSDAPDIGLADAFAVSLKKDHKNLLLGYSYPPLQSIDLTLNQYHVELASIVQQIADVGFAWQTLSLNPLNSNNVTKDPVAQQLFDSSIVTFASALRKKHSE